MIERIKYDVKARKDFLLLNRDVVKSWVVELIGKKVIYGFSDELSVSLMAFNESIDKFNGDGDFYQYAYSQVKSKLYATSFLQKKVAKKI